MPKPNIIGKPLDFTSKWHEDGKAEGRIEMIEQLISVFSDMPDDTALGPSIFISLLGQIKDKEGK